jgi:hypothetical protein
MLKKLLWVILLYRQAAVDYPLWCNSCCGLSSGIDKLLWIILCCRTAAVEYSLFEEKLFLNSWQLLLFLCLSEVNVAYPLAEADDSYPLFKRSSCCLSSVTKKPLLRLVIQMRVNNSLFQKLFMLFNCYSTYSPLFLL